MSRLRKVACILFLLLPLTVVFAEDEAGETSSAESPLVDLASRIEAKPNDARLHLELAQAYWDRGARGDALRVMRHLRRAVELDPSLEDEARGLASRGAPGRQEEPTDGSAQTVDRRIAATLPAGMNDGAPHEEEAIHLGLAERLGQRNFRRGRDFASERADLTGIFDWRGAEQPSWTARFHELSGQSHSGGFASLLAEVAPNLLRATRTGGLEGHAFAVPKDEVTTESVNLFETKSEAAVALLDGQFETAMEKLLDTVAAAESLLRGRDAIAATTAVIQDVHPGDAGRAGILPVVFDPRGTGAPAFLPGNPAEDGGNTELVHAVSQLGMETLEAMANPEVSRETASQKAVELACLGNCGSPLLVDLDGDGLPGTRESLLPDGRFVAASAVPFDLDGRGRVERVEWLLPGRDALLAADLNGNGLVDSGAELFGTAHGDPDGWHRLARWDVDGDGEIRGRELAGLLLWVDDGDGRCRSDELRSVAELGVETISCRPRNNRAWIRLEGRSLAVWDWWPELR